MADKAWARYDVDTGRMTSVSWTRPDGEDCIEIPGSMAREFMLGDLRMVAFAVGGKGLETLETHERYQEFWNLVPIDPGDDRMAIDGNVIMLCIGQDGRRPAMLFATLDNNPSWLVRSWKISWDCVDSQGRISIEFDRPERYSYYCWIPG